MRPGKLFIYCQPRRTWQQQVHFSYNTDPFSSFVNFVVYVIKETKFRMKKQNYNPGQNIWQKLKRYNKIGQDFKNIISNFACFSTAIVNV